MAANHCKNNPKVHSREEAQSYLKESFFFFFFHLLFADSRLLGHCRVLSATGHLERGTNNPKVQTPTCFRPHVAAASYFPVSHQESDEFTKLLHASSTNVRLNATTNTKHFYKTIKTHLRQPRHNASN